MFNPRVPHVSVSLHKLTGFVLSSLLASGSDDQHVIIWDPFRHTKLITMHTGHAANIFSVKVKSMSRFFSLYLVNVPECAFSSVNRVCLQFLPHSGDRILITGAADTKVHVHDLTAKETIHMFSDHTNRVKRIATAPMWPNTFWSAAEDGIIRYGEFSLRRHTVCSQIRVCPRWFVEKLQGLRIELYHM